jgi:hypothetical protein
MVVTAATNNKSKLNVQGKLVTYSIMTYANERGPHQLPLMQASNHDNDRKIVMATKMLPRPKPQQKDTDPEEKL